jgi:CubicO group peptidase (beta-lactamase class C family)
MVMKVTVPADLIGGDVDDGYGKLADVFRRNLTSGEEIGAAVAVYRDGKKVVDLWGGYRNGHTKEQWQEDTVVNVFSTTKGVAGLSVALAASRGLISYDAKVADYWPEFAQGGKDAITVRQLLCHQAGLAVIRPMLTLDDLADPSTMSPKLAAQVPAWAPGTRHGYHAITIGWYEGELIRRADPAGRTIGRFFAEEIAQPLGLDLYIGLPGSVNRDRVAYLHGWTLIETLLHLNLLSPRFVVAVLNPFSVEARSIAPAKGLTKPEFLNREELRTTEMPGMGGIGTARSVAKLYGSAAHGGSEIGLTPTILDALKELPTPPTEGWRDKILHIDTLFSLGFTKPFPTFVFGASDTAFGTPGTGGSFGFADPDTGIGFAYVMNRMGFHPWSDPRELSLRTTLFQDVLGARPQT